jgi:hypothetical protein
MKLNPVQNQFTAGELTPLMYARSDIEGYAAGLKTCRNMVTRNQGPVVKRPGFEHINIIGGEYARVFPFQLSRQSPLGEAFPIIMSDAGFLQVYGALGQVAGEQLIVNPLFDEGSMGWTVINPGNTTVVFVNGVCTVTVDQIDTNFAGVTQAVSIDPKYYNQNFSYEVVAPVLQGFTRYPPLVVRVGTTPGGSEITLLPGNKFNVGTNPTIYISVLFQGGYYNDVIIPGEPDELGTYTRSIERVSVRTPPIAEGELIFTTDWDAEDIRNSWWAMPPNGDEMYILTPKKRPYLLSYDSSIDSWTFDEVAFTGKPSTWVDGSWPSCLAFFQGRAWWSGVENEPEKIWSSPSALDKTDYRRFTSGVTDSDSVIFTNSRRGKINWIEGVRNLLFGSVYGEFIATAQNGLITPSDIRIEQQSANGSAPFQTLVTGTSVLYASGDRRKLRTAGFQWTEQSWVSRDITFTSEHLSKESEYTQVAYARNPDSIMWFVQSNGKFIGATLESFANLIGWHRHDTDGQILSLAALEFQGKSDVYAIVSRFGQLRLEKMDNNIHLDAFSRITNETPSTLVTGLDHLNGCEVSVVVDGALQKNKTVSSGSIEVDRPGLEIVVGIPFKSEIESLPYEGGYPVGSAQPAIKRRSRITLRVQDSVIPEVNGLRPPVRTAGTPMNQRQPNYSGLIDVTDTGFTKDGSFNVSDSTPFNLCVTGIYTQVELNQL